MIKINTPFYVPFFERDCEFFEDIRDDLISIIMEIHNKDPFAIQGNFPKGKLLKYNLTESNSNFLQIEHKSIKKIRSWINQNLIDSYKIIKIETQKVNIKSSWFHVTKTGGFHNMHMHPNTPLAAIFYIESGNSDIGNSWINPITGYIDNLSSKWCQSTFTSKFVPGKLIIFPGWLLHSAPPHQGDKLRILLSLNSTPIV